MPNVKLSRKEISEILIAPEFINTLMCATGMNGFLGILCHYCLL